MPSNSTPENEVDRKAEWGILTLLCIVGLYFLYDTFFISSGDGTVFITLGKAMLAAALFAVSSWAAFRVGGVLAVMFTLPLLATTILAFVAPPIDRIEKLSKEINDVSAQTKVKMIEQNNDINALSLRIDKFSFPTIIKKYKIATRVNERTKTFNINGSSRNHICFISGISFSGTNDHIGKVELLTPGSGQNSWRIYIARGSSDTVEASVFCLGLPLK